MTRAKDLISMKVLIEERIVPWRNEKTVRRKIKDNEFPHVFADGRYFFDPKEVDLWFKRREGIRAS